MTAKYRIYYYFFSTNRGVTLFGAEWGPEEGRGGGGNIGNIGQLKGQHNVAMSILYIKLYNLLILKRLRGMTSIWVFCFV